MCVIIVVVVAVTCAFPAEALAQVHSYGGDSGGAASHQQGRSGGRESRVTALPPKQLRTSGAKSIPGAISEEIISSDPDCGANALFAFLRLSGIPCSREEVKRQVTIDESGATMLELKNVANRLGVKAKVVRVSPTELVEYGHAVARIESADGSEAHYVVVVRGKDGTLSYIDGSTGVYARCPLDRFERSFSGFALVPITKAVSLQTLFIAANVIAISLVFGAFAKPRKLQPEH